MAKNYVLIPAAGSGSRMGSEIPKQYLPLLGKPLLQHTINIFSNHPAITQVFVVLAPGDTHQLADCQLLRCGGETRAESVLNGLQQIPLGQDDWVLVHDAARPCLSRMCLSRMLHTLGAETVGGLLAVPAADTLKLADTKQRVAQTLSRENVWQAQTPQMFRYGVLRQALEASGSHTATDEAQAVERLGFSPKLVMGERSNLKVTFPEDLEMAEMLLQARGEK